MIGEEALSRHFGSFEGSDPSFALKMAVHAAQSNRLTALVSVAVMGGVKIEFHQRWYSIVLIVVVAEWRFGIPDQLLGQSLDGSDWRRNGGSNRLETLVGQRSAASVLSEDLVQIVECVRGFDDNLDIPFRSMLFHALVFLFSVRLRVFLKGKVGDVPFLVQL